MNEEKARKAMELARNDLSFALSCPETLQSPHAYGRSRLEQSIRLITDALEDHETFEKLKARWTEEEKKRE